jgi:hypothetical protein
MHFFRSHAIIFPRNIDERNENECASPTEKAEEQLHSATSSLLAWGLLHQNTCKVANRL